MPILLESVDWQNAFAHALLTFKRSKADRNHSVNIVLAATNEAACPVEGLSKLFLHDSQPTTAPLFMLSSGPFTSSAFQRAVISKLNRAGEDTTDFMVTVSGNGQHNTPRTQA